MVHRKKECVIQVFVHLQVHNHSTSNAAIWQRSQRRVVSCRVRASMENFTPDFSDDGSLRSRTTRRAASEATHDSRSEIRFLLDEDATLDSDNGSTAASTMDEAASDPPTSVVSDGEGDQPVNPPLPNHAMFPHLYLNPNYIYTPSSSSSTRSTSFGSLGWGSDVDLFLDVYRENIIVDDDQISWVSHDFGASDGEKDCDDV